jgi:hypothetical protein
MANGVGLVFPDNRKPLVYRKCFCEQVGGWAEIPIIRSSRRGVLRKRRQFFRMRGHQAAGRYTPAGHFLGGLLACIILGAVRTGCCGLGKVFVPAFERAGGLLKGTTREQQSDHREYPYHCTAPPVKPSAPAHTCVFYYTPVGFSCWGLGKNLLLTPVREVPPASVDIPVQRCP